MTDRLDPSRLDRAELISLLETLGSENDEEVLAAARVLDTKVTAAGRRRRSRSGGRGSRIR